MAFVQLKNNCGLGSLFSQNGNYSSETEDALIRRLKPLVAAANTQRHTSAFIHLSIMLARFLIVLSAIACALAFQSIAVSKNALSRQVRLKSRARMSLHICKRSFNQSAYHADSFNCPLIGNHFLNMIYFSLCLI